MDYRLVNRPVCLESLAPQRKARHRGKEKIASMFLLTAAAYNLVRMRNLSVSAIV